MCVKPSRTFSSTSPLEKYRTPIWIAALMCVTLSGPLAVWGQITTDSKPSEAVPTQAAPELVNLAQLKGLPSRIAFGSCGHQDKPQPILNTIVSKAPDLFIYLGDNIYGDTKDMKVLQAKYDTLGRKPEFQKLRAAVPVLSIWDDHDFGWNDAGKEYEFKAESKEIFMDFWEVPANSERRQHPGIYGSHRFEQVIKEGVRDSEPESRSLQIILLDTRTFRDPLKQNTKPIAEGSGFKNAYQPDGDPNKTLLGEAQWAWLETVLSEPADLRIICSSIQFGHEYNGWESWTNLPAEQKRMADLIRKTEANGVLFISGDVHWGEISRRSFSDLYPIYDVTASGLTEEWYNVEPNRLRVGEAYRDNHFGMLEIDWEAKDPEIVMMIVNTDGKTCVRHEVPLSELQLPDKR